MRPHVSLEPSVDCSATAPYSTFAPTPYTWRGFLDRCERSLHRTNRSQYTRDENHFEKWFVTSRVHVRECLTEFLGTFVMICFGVGVNNQVALSDDSNGTWLSINLAWGIAVLIRGRNKILQFNKLLGFPI
ncbi:hypothetical protein PR003_g23776 [Phytophthora rubi]|uniref:Uncharacterized protein n=2 Tax=Phytophthora TaxID=4783 RepID=A0A6A3QIE1_9STRA|nr:hypothetical protein PF003_g7441 [Phytophthora fragariae]KAE9075818.1 hypothetical protein PF006_g28256 [Phytophthora fragariae]KAE9271197.1 hypothetical protein PF001_g28485 [Phytophthora fragariae]KAE9296374.1 hypothetical protein PR003_g23776 [Phytophthora rubi]